MRVLDKVIGYEDIKKELYKLLDIINNPKKYEALGVTIPKGLLLNGNPGIGKTLMAKCFITESGRKSFVIKKDKPNGSFVDYIRETFEKAAAEAPSIILLDDMDKFANEDDIHRNAEEYVAVQSCIDDVKDKDVFVIATCNDAYRYLPHSLVRTGRFDKTFDMKFPGIEDAKKIIEFYLKNKKVADDIDVEEIARFCERHSCADLESIINEAGTCAGFENREFINQDDIIKACMRIIHFCYDSSEYSEEAAKRIAVHEAGHAVMIELFYPGQVNFVSLCRGRGSEGRVCRHIDENKFDTFNSKEINIMIDLAGKAATELILNEIDMGALIDLDSAFREFRWLWGSLSLYDFISRDQNEETSQQMLNHLESVAGAEMSRYYLKTKQLLGKNREFLEAVIDALIEKKTLSYKDIAPIREKFVKDNRKVA